jgi:hypothetical protein
MEDFGHRVAPEEYVFRTRVGRSRGLTNDNAFRLLVECVVESARRNVSS